MDAIYDFIRTRGLSYLDGTAIERIARPKRTVDDLRVARDAINALIVQEASVQKHAVVGETRMADFRKAQVPWPDPIGAIAGVGGQFGAPPMGEMREKLDAQEAWRRTVRDQDAGNRALREKLDAQEAWRRVEQAQVERGQAMLGKMTADFGAGAVTASRAEEERVALREVRILGSRP